MKPAPPTALVVRNKGRFVTIACPYCRGEHVHEIRERDGHEWRAPHCGMFLSPAQRAAGYRFQTPTERTNP